MYMIKIIEVFNNNRSDDKEYAESNNPSEY